MSISKTKRTQGAWRAKARALLVTAAAFLGAEAALPVLFDTPRPSLLVAPALADDDDDDGGGGGGGAGGGIGAGPEGGGGWRPPAGGVRLNWPWSAQRQARPPARPILVALVPADVDRRRIVAAGFEVVEEREVTLPQGRLMRLAAPARLSLEASLGRLRGLSPGIVADRNHRYRARYRTMSGAGAGGAAVDPFALMRWPVDPACAVQARVAMIDTAWTLTTRTCATVAWLSPGSWTHDAGRPEPSMARPSRRSCCVALAAPRRTVADRHRRVPAP